MSNCNDFLFAKHLDQFKLRVLDPQKRKVSEADAIMCDPKHQWKDAEQKTMAGAKCESYKQWLSFYQAFYDEGLKLCTQHENLVNKTAKWYSRWYDEVSNEGKQETEIMSAQADSLNEIFSEMFKELLPLKLDIKPPSPLNMK